MARKPNENEPEKPKTGRIVVADQKVISGEGKFHIRDHPVKGIRYHKWVWPEKDKEGWEGPIQNWNNSHSAKYFEHLTKYEVVVTAGAECGIHCRGYAERGFKAIYAFEPDANNFYALSRNTVGLDNVYKFNAALGKKPGSCGMVFNQHNAGGHQIDRGSLNKPNTGATIPMLTIDLLNLWECDLIQLDVEGWELEVLIGAYNTIKEFRPVVISENKSKELISYMNNHGYVDAGRSEADTIWIHSNPNV
jgi:FkbM family methyltransferase